MLGGHGTARRGVATAFYSGLLGWTTADTRRQAGSPQRYFVGQIEGGAVAGITSRMDEALTGQAWNT